MLSQVRPIIYRMLSTQVLVVIIFAAILFFSKNAHAAYSALLGGAINILANLYFARRVFNYTGAQAARKIMQNFYKAELIKVLLTGAFFVAILKWQLAQPFIFFLGYIIAQLGFWIAAMTYGRRMRSAGVTYEC